MNQLLSASSYFSYTCECDINLLMDKKANSCITWLFSLCWTLFWTRHAATEHRLFLHEHHYFRQSVINGLFSLKVLSTVSYSSSSWPLVFTPCNFHSVITTHSLYSQVCVKMNDSYIWPLTANTEFFFRQLLNVSPTLWIYCTVLLKLIGYI